MNNDCLNFIFDMHAVVATIRMTVNFLSVCNLYRNIMRNSSYLRVHEGLV